MPDTFHHALRQSSLGSTAVRRLASRTTPESARRVLHPDPTTSNRAAGAKKGIPMPTNRTTSSKAATAASKTLRDGRTSKTSKTAAANALSQRAPKKNSKR